MVYEDRNLAYDLRLFEEDDIYSSVKAPEKKQAKHESKKEKLNKEVDASTDKAKKPIRRIKRRKNNFFRLSGAVVLAAMIVLVVSLIIHGQVQLTELNQQISAAQETLEEQKSLYTQLEMKVDASISTAVVEEYAQDKLGMTKVANSQKEFVNLSEGDKVEVTLPSSTNVFEAIAQAIASILS